MTPAPETVPGLRSLDGFSHIAFAKSPCPAILLAISRADPDEILEASRHAIRQVRGDHATACISDMTLAEMDYAFTNLEFFLSRVGNYGTDAPTLREWSAKPRNDTIYYAVEVRPPDGAPEPAAMHAVAVLGRDLVCPRNPKPAKIAETDVADWRVGQVFAINRMADTRWSA